MENIQKNCHYCFYIRPKKNNHCIMLKKIIEQPHSYCCDYFSLDTIIIRTENNRTENKKS